MDQKPSGSRTSCIRCGECCLKSSPTLHEEDIPLIMEGFIGKHDLYTIRAGELVLDNVQGRIKITGRELIKVRETPKGGCIFYNPEALACTIYAHRPIQCAALVCWDDSEFMRVYDRPRADRRKIIRNNTLLRLLEEHEKRCAYAELEKYVKNIEKDGEEAVRKIIRLLKIDYSLRPLVAEKMGLKITEMDFLFGRPLIDTIAMFGLKVTRETDGSFFVTSI